jgi:IS30 family transposase
MGTNYSHLSADDRTAIQALILVKTKVALIAERLGFSRATIYRELNRGKADPTALRDGYRATRAHDRARAKRHWAGFGRRKLPKFDTPSPFLPGRQRSGPMESRT